MTMTELERRCVDAAGRIYGARISDPSTVGYRLDLVRAILAEAGVGQQDAEVAQLRQALTDVKAACEPPSDCMYCDAAYASAGGALSGQKGD